MNVAKPWPFGETVVRAVLVGVTYRGTGALSRTDVLLVLHTTNFFQRILNECREALTIRRNGSES